MNVDEDRYENPDDDPRGPFVLATVTAPFERPNLTYEWNGVLPPEGRSWRYTEERAQALQDEGRIVFSRSGWPRLKRYLDERPQDQEEVDGGASVPSPEFIVRTAMRELAALVGKNPDGLREIEWRDLERLLREVFESLGFMTRLTNSSHDGGFDLQLDYRDGQRTVTYLVEVKHWLSSRTKVGPAIASALLDVVLNHPDADRGLVLSTSGFTGPAISGRAEIESHVVRLGGQEKVVSLCNHYLKVRDNLWRPVSELGDLLTEGTF